MTYRTVRFPSGREVGMAGLGDPAGGRLAVLLHPTPGASGFDPAPEATARSGIHLLTFERPGYGASEPSDVSVAGWADDLAGHLREVEATARTAGRTRFGRVGIVGWREGGVYAAVLAARHPDLVDALVLVAAPSPSHAAGASEQARGSLAAESPWPEPAGFSDRLQRMLDAAKENGDDGITRDRRAFEESIAPPPQSDTRSLILYGTDDDYATVRDAHWYAAGFPDAIVERVEGGADIIGREWERVLSFLRQPG
ncbi:alpha/beta fold hydrolase [Leifsonia soli]|uniref:Pimeloyl-ACP methyl ester carboxylesterase n=1 Tax=Leifsonia soli TaxID=582665 RepID=A0A852T1I1_9MICO|nr:alpha/beta hydrolase [Leifsonia soli]NYD74574.1 pimeloyl-ACP methyl ester carboxylesterase [Leifsonia soli]